jgi:hypothetical protein
LDTFAFLFGYFEVLFALCHWDVPFFLTALIMTIMDPLPP